MPDQILKDVTQLGSKLADIATQQLDDVLSELRGPIGATSRDASPADQTTTVNVGRLAFSVMQLVSRLGSMVTELSNYDLVHRGTPTLFLNSVNPLTDLTVPAGKGGTYELLVENNGKGESGLILEAKLTSPSAPDRILNVTPALAEVAGSERRRVAVELPPLDPLGRAAYTLVMTLSRKDENERVSIVARKTVVMNVLPGPQQPTPGAPKSKAPKHSASKAAPAPKTRKKAKE